jgi:transposase-like protein
VALDEVFIKINGEQKYLWRAVDRDGDTSPTSTPPSTSA